MLSFRRSALVLVAAAAMAVGQPALTTVQDILYRADGTRFNGTMFITWDSFQAGDTSNIATANLTLPIVNGVLKVALVPTTTASAGAQYDITYNAQGRNQFTEIWAVPPSGFPVSVSAVRVSQGTIIGPAPVTTAAVNISDVTGLQQQLLIRPQQGTAFAVGRTAVINSSGQIDGAAGNLTDCVRVDGSSGACGSSGGGGIAPVFSDGETPVGALNGVNTVFTLAFSPSPAASLDLYLNGLLMKLGTDYLLNSNTVTFLTASTPQSGDFLTANYRYANPGNPLGSLTAAQVVCSSTGGSTSSTSMTQLGTCTMPAGLLGVGDRIEIQFQYGHSGASTGFTGEVHFGGLTALSRATTAGETALVGRLSFGLFPGAQFMDVQSWGNSLAFGSSVGAATENIALSVTISFLGLMAGSTTDSVNLRNFTVVRYPAQANP